MKSHLALLDLKGVLLALVIAALLMMGAALGLAWWPWPTPVPHPTALVTLIPLPTATATVPPSPTSTLQGTATAIPPPPPLPGEITIGVYVQISGTGGDGLRLRASPGLSAPVRFLGREAEVFLVTDGPREADGYTWWYLVAPYDETRSGWAAANYLSPLTLTPTPETAP